MKDTGYWMQDSGNKIQETLHRQNKLIIMYPVSCILYLASGIYL